MDARKKFSASLRFDVEKSVAGFVNSLCLRVFVFATWAGGICVYLRDLWFLMGGRVALCLLRVSVSLRFEHRTYTQNASTRKQNPNSSRPQASPASSKKPRALITKGFDMRFPPFRGMGSLAWFCRGGKGRIGEGEE